MFNTDNRGQVGIGTLIVFIAMVLVAAIAAGVLINTAGLLQAQAQQTGAETTSEVSDRLQIGNVVGLTNNTGKEKIELLNASVRLAAGSDPINLSKASYTIASSENASIINGSQAGDAVNFTRKQSLDTTTSILADQEDLMVVSFNLTLIDGINQLDDGRS
ncbi:MAG: archaeal flagellin N-terminal-like domain protein [uncultured archaeon A07HN63]|nr:MAG: archaeal flagellin N-terminal-like domain protein [uncultured archaeon A07HN63]